MLVGSLSGAALGGAGETVGYPELVDRLGGAVPDGDTVIVAQVEANDAGVPGRYLPPAANPEFANVMITPQSGSGTTSSHAREVGFQLYGLTMSMTPGIPTVHAYELNDYLFGELQSNSANDPLPTPFDIRIVNNSWGGSASIANDILRRLDRVIVRDDIVMCFGLPNGIQADFDIPKGTFNGITVGLTNATHYTTDVVAPIDVPGRMKPDIVAPSSLTSFATPQVSSAAALLIDGVLDATTGGIDLTNAQRSEVIKGVILAGATRGPGWTNNPATSGADRGSTDRPYDDTFGAGTLNVDDAHRLLFAGEFDGSTSFPFEPNVPTTGWDLIELTSGNTAFYRFDLPSNAERGTILATWHREVTEAAVTFIAANIDLELYRVTDTGGFESIVGPAGETVFDAGNVRSNSDVDNVELLDFTTLIAGEYLLFVTVQSAGVPHDVAVVWDFALSEPPAPPCPQDCSPVHGDGTFGNGVVNVDDLFLVINEFGNTGGPCDNAPDNGDGTFGNGVVNVDDLFGVLNAFGDCPTP